MDNSQFIIDNEINRCYADLKNLESTPKRTQKFTHKEDISKLQGKIDGLKMAKILIIKSEPNLIEQ